MGQPKLLAQDTQLLPWGTGQLPWDTRMLLWGTGQLPWDTRLLLGAELLFQDGECPVQLTSCYQCVSEEVEVSLHRRGGKGGKEVWPDTWRSTPVAEVFCLSPTVRAHSEPSRGDPGRAQQ